jgi:phosphotransferase system  glucose/maltose/N-acetylglucosamine-specific IIC component
MKEKVMNGLEKFSKAMLSPLSYISAAGLILVLGALLTSTSLSAMIPVLQWTPIKLLGQLIYNCIMVIINNLSLMFCVGIAAALAKKNKQQAAIIGLMSYFMYLTAGNVTLTQLGMLAEPDPMVGLYGTGQSTVFGIQTVDMGVFGGILLGLVCGWVYNRTCEKQFKGIITQIYSGNRWSFTCMVVFSILFGFGSCFFWPPVQNVISALTDLIATSGNFGLFLYGFLERFLIPTGLHPLPVLCTGQQPDRGRCHLHRLLHRHDDGVQHGSALLGRHRVDVHRLHQDLRLLWHRGGLHLLRPQGEPQKDRCRSGAAGLYRFSGLYHRAAGFHVLLHCAHPVGGTRLHLRPVHRAAAHLPCHRLYHQPPRLGADEPFRRCR